VDADTSSTDTRPCVVATHTRRRAVRGAAGPRESSPRRSADRAGGQRPAMRSSPLNVRHTDEHAIPAVWQRLHGPGVGTPRSPQSAASHSVGRRERFQNRCGFVFDQLPSSARIRWYESSLDAARRDVLSKFRCGRPYTDELAEVRIRLPLRALPIATHADLVPASRRSSTACSSFPTGRAVFENKNKKKTQKKKKKKKKKNKTPGLRPFYPALEQ